MKINENNYSIQVLIKSGNIRSKQYSYNIRGVMWTIKTSMHTQVIISVAIKATTQMDI